MHGKSEFLGHCIYICAYPIHFNTCIQDINIEFHFIIETSRRNIIKNNIPPMKENNYKIPSTMQQYNTIYMAEAQVN